MNRIDPHLLDAYRQGQAAGHAKSLGDDSTQCPFACNSGARRRSIACWMAWQLGKVHWRADVLGELRTARGMHLWKDGERYRVNRFGIMPN